jgi:hypothetical protein
VAGTAGWRWTRARARGAAERQAGDVGPPEGEAVDEGGQAVGVAGHAERLRRVGGAAGAGGVPGHHREVVAEVVELAPPGGRAVADVAVQEDEEGAVAGAFVGDAEAVDLDRPHRGPCHAQMSPT